MRCRILSEIFRAIFIALTFWANLALSRAPAISFVYPAGGAKGSTFKIQIGVLDAGGITGASISGGDVEIKVGKVRELSEERRKAAAARDEAKGLKILEAEVSISDDAKIGMRDLRISNRDGTSNRFRFIVGEIPEIMEHGENQVLSTLPVCVNGQLLEADKDTYLFNLKRGATLVAEVSARAIKPYIADAVPGWIQPVLRLFNPDGNEVAYNDDFKTSPDPVLIYTASQAGTYRLEIRDAMYRGRDDFVYRIRIGELPFVTAFYPIGCRLGERTKISLSGVNLPYNSFEFDVSGGMPRTETFRIQKGALFSNEIIFDYDDKPEFDISDGEEIPSEATAIPATFNGRFTQSGKPTFVKFFAKKGTTLVMETFARRLGGVADTSLALFDARNMKLIAENDDYDDPTYGLITHNSDSRIIRKFEHDGEYILRILESQRHFGVGYAYRLKVDGNRPDFSVSVSPDNPQVARDGFIPMKFIVARMGGFDGDVEISAPDLPSGFSLDKCVIKKGKNEAFAIFRATNDVPMKPLNPQFLTTAIIDGKKASKIAQASEELMQAFYYMHSIPVEQINMSVLPRAPFKLEWCEIPDTPLSFAAGNTHELEMRVVREKGFDKQVRINLYRGLSGLQSKSTVVNPKDEKIMVSFKSTTNVANLITGDLLVIATARDGENTYQALAPLGVKYRVAPRPSSIKKGK